MQVIKTNGSGDRIAMDNFLQVGRIFPGCTASLAQSIPRWWQLKYIFMFTPNLVEMIQFDFRIFFYMGWFNHQLEMACSGPGD